MLLKGKAKIVYDPYRGDMKANTSWWCVGNTDSEICRYYRWWVWRRYMIELINPAWGAHISIVRGEEPRDSLKHLWKKYDGEILEFEYSPNVRYSGDTVAQDNGGVFWFIDVLCPKMNDIRKELGLMYQRDGIPFKYHLTIGRIK